MLNQCKRRLDSCNKCPLKFRDHEHTSTGNEREPPPPPHPRSAPATHVLLQFLHDSYSSEFHYFLNCSERQMSLLITHSLTPCLPSQLKVFHEVCIIFSSFRTQNNKHRLINLAYLTAVKCCFAVLKRNKYSHTELWTLGVQRQCKDVGNTTVGSWGCWKSVSVLIHTHTHVLSPLLDWEDRRGEEAVRQSGREKEKRRK